MKIEYGQTKTESLDPEGSTITVVESIHKGEVVKTIRHFRIKVKVNNSREETTQYLEFTNDLRLKREAGTLSIDREDRETIPAFLIEYPRTDIDGSYFILKCWAELI